MTEVLSYRNQSIDLLCKAMEWFLFDRDLRREKVKYDYWLEHNFVFPPALSLANSNCMMIYALTVIKLFLNSSIK